MSRSASESRARGLIWPGFFTLLMLAFLVSLGIWQMQRLNWKNDILARLDARIHAAPIPLPPSAEWQNLAAQDYEYTRVSVTGTFEHKSEALVFRPTGGVGNKPGYHVLTPLRISGGGYVLINRGFVPEDLKAPAARAAGQVEGEVKITGLLRAPETRSSFTPADDAGKGLWFTRDPIAIARHYGLADAAPFSIDADASDIPGGWPRGGATVVSIRNDHLAYAMTWFGLAATLAAVFGLFAWRRVKPT
jgi:surfeit locus 1 family protein